MNKATGISVLNRRSLLLSAAGTALAYPAWWAIAQETAQTVVERSKLFEEAMSVLLKGATPVEGKITLELPEIAENGNFVPLTVSVDSLMTDDNYVKTIHILSSANPVARVATFHLSPVNSIARVQSRMRLAKTQDVFAIAELSDGSLAIGTATVKVTIGGCSS